MLAEKQDVETLKEAMISMFDADLRKTFGENGRKRIENEFERGLMVERICRDYLELYELRCKNKEK